MTFVDPIKNSDDAFQTLEAIAANRGKKDKLRLLTAACKYPKFLNVCKLALDPFITYGVKKFELPEASGGDTFGDETLQLLNGLASRDLTGNKAQSEISTHLATLTQPSKTLLGRIIKRDLRAGFSAKSVNKASPGSIYVFDCMLAQKYEEKRIKSWPVAVEPKYDGVRCLAIYKEGEVKFYSREGKEFLNYEHVAAELKQAVERFDRIPGITGISASGKNETKLPMLFDGEIMSGEINETAGAAQRKNQQAASAKFYIFEAMPLDDFDNGTGETYLKRRARLTIFFNEVASSYPALVLPPMWPLESHDEIMAKHIEIMAEGGEGVIVKPLTGRYEKKRSFSWLKIKDKNSADCVIVGHEEGEGKCAGKIGKFVVDFDGVEVGVGSGLTDLIRDEYPLDGTEHIGKLIQVDYHEITPDLSMRHPRFIAWRDDKPIEDGIGV